MVFELLLTAGLVAFSFALRSFQSAFLFRLGSLGILVASYLLGWILTGLHWGGALCLSVWFLFPWVDIVGRVRHIEMPDSQPVESQVPPGPHRFPALDELTEEAEAEGFVRIDDFGWSISETRHFLRILVNPASQMRASINLVETEDMSFYYIDLRSDTVDGKVYHTTNYPFSMSLTSPPHWQIKRATHVESFVELVEEHRALLLRRKVEHVAPVPNTMEALKAGIEREMRSQVLHNVSRGFLLQCGEGVVKYSWKGCFFLWIQFVKELVRVF